MAGDDNEAGGGGEEEKKADAAGDDEDAGGDTCCAQYGRGILACLKGIYAFLKYIFMAIANCLGLCWYPFKERTGDCCDCCGKRLRPHTDPAYGGF